MCWRGQTGASPAYDSKITCKKNVVDITNEQDNIYSGSVKENAKGNQTENKSGKYGTNMMQNIMQNMTKTTRGVNKGGAG